MPSQRSAPTRDLAHPVPLHDAEREALVDQALRGDGPYIVSAYRNGPWPHTSGQREGLSWLRCATLGDAQYELDEQIEAHGGSIDEWPDVDADGGIIGPLPERVYVEVRREVSR